MPNLESVGYISMDTNALLTRIDLPNLTTVTGYISVNNNDRLPERTPRVARVGEYVYLNDNDALTTLSMPQLVSVDGYVYLNDNDALTTMDGAFLVGGTSACTITMP